MQNESEKHIIFFNIKIKGKVIIYHINCYDEYKLFFSFFELCLNKLFLLILENKY